MTAAPSAPAQAPAWWEDGRAPGVFDGEFAGHIGAGGLALVAVAILLLATARRAKHPISETTAIIGAFAAAQILSGAGGIWATPADLVYQTLQALGVGAGDGPLGNVGMGAVAAVLLALAWFKEWPPRRGVYLGLIIGIVWSGAGGIWGTIASITSQVTGGIA